MCILNGAWKHKLNKTKNTEMHFPTSAVIYAKFFWEPGSKRRKIVVGNEDSIFLPNTFTYTKFLIHLLVIKKLDFYKEITGLITQV